MWGSIILTIIAIIVALTIYFQARKIEELEKYHLQLKFNCENQILEILSDVKELENKYATAGTAMCRYLKDKIAYHSRIYYRYKNELNISSDDE